MPGGIQRMSNQGTITNRRPDGALRREIEEEIGVADEGKRKPGCAVLLDEYVRVHESSDIPGYWLG